MAHIPVNPTKKGIPGWVWAILAIALIVVAALFLFSLADDEETTVIDRDSTTVVTPAPAPRETVYSLDSLTDASGADLASLAGQRIEAEDVEVSRVIGDSAFVARSTSGRDILVVLRDGATASSAGGFAISQGDRVRLNGTLQQAGADLRGIPQAARSALRTGALYVTASAADVVAAVRTMNDVDVTETPLEDIPEPVQDEEDALSPSPEAVDTDSPPDTTDQ